jgi:hypothetical protein
MAIASFFRTLCLRVLPFQWRLTIIGPTDEEFAMLKKWREERSRYSEEEQNRLRKIERSLRSPNEQW